MPARLAFSLIAFLTTLKSQDAVAGLVFSSAEAGAVVAGIPDAIAESGQGSFGASAAAINNRVNPFTPFPTTASASASASASGGGVSATGSAMAQGLGSWAQSSAQASAELRYDFGAKLFVATQGNVQMTGGSWRADVLDDGLIYAPSSSVFLFASAGVSLHPFFLPQGPWEPVSDFNTSSITLTVIEESAQSIAARWNANDNLPIHVHTQGAGIEAFFSPVNRWGDAIPLATMAKGFGFDHFNWINQIVGIPANWDSWIIKGVRDPNDVFINTETGELVFADNTPVTSAPYTTPITDPPYDLAEDQHIVFRMYDGQRWHVQALSHPATFMPSVFEDAWDSRPFYYNEVVVDPRYGQVPEYATHQGTFYDAPSIGRDLFGEGQYLQFATTLVGVDANGQMRRLPGVDIGFRWKTNAVNIQDVWLFKYQGDTTGLIASGGVFDVEPFVIHSASTVPEPTSLALLGIGVLSLCGARWRRGVTSPAGA